MKYGLEHEFFVRDNKTNELIGPLAGQFTPDECGFLAEARGRPCDTIREAVFSLRADTYRLIKEAEKGGVTLIEEPLMEVPRPLILACRKKFGKGTLSYENLYGHQEHHAKGRKTAGIHISFTSEKEIYHRYHDGREYRSTINGIFDFVQIFRKLDKAFAEEIKKAKRRPGFYELKSDGRIEYRSLPNNVNLDKIIEVLS